MHLKRAYKKGHNTECKKINYKGIEIENPDSERQAIFRYNNEEIPFRPKEKEVFLYLIKNRNIILSPVQIYDSCWDSKEGRGDVSKTISDIRKKLKKFTKLDGKNFIKTYFASGFEAYDK